MSQSFASIHLHILFSTKDREPWIAAGLKQRLYDHIGETLRGSGCDLVAAGGMPDHVHLLVAVGRELSVADVVRLVKSTSSRWIHDTFPELAEFSWQVGYGAFAVGFASIAEVRRYIANQAELHATQSFEEEYREFLRRHKIEWDERFLWE